ncbi:YhcN/YlaJ family sporulation lipoprotein [Paenibacillaceae bacterium]|nr:YhcN/YlaJ family sporulation lipoprotein [Paenibacillaceae bacterium]
MYIRTATTILLCLLIAGCGTAARNKNENQPPNQNQNQLHSQQAANQEGEKEPADLNIHLEKLAENVPGVQRAHCVVIGNTAVVGIDVDGNLERSRVGTIKYSVAEAFRKDPYGADAIVTADLDMSHRLAEIREDIRQGNPISGFTDEMADIIGRIIPQMPRDTVQPEPDETEVPNPDLK